MELLDSTRELLWGIIKRLYWLIPSLFTDPFDFIERWFKITYEPPSYLFWVLIGMGLAIATVMTYNDVKKQNASLHSQIKVQEWSARRKRLIELREPYLPEVINVLKRMTARMEKLVEEASKNPIDYGGKLNEVSNYVFKEVGLPKGSEESDKRFLLELQCAMDAYNLGLSKSKVADIEWSSLSEQLSQLRGHVADRELSERIEEFMLVLDGVSNYKLFGLFIDKYENNRELREKAKAIGARRGLDKFLNTILSRVNRRVEELMSGDEAK